VAYFFGPPYIYVCVKCVRHINQQTAYADKQVRGNHFFSTGGQGQKSSFMMRHDPQPF